MTTQATTSKRFVLSINVMHMGEGLDDFNCFVIEIDPALAELILKRMRQCRDIKALDQDLFQLRYWDYNGDFFDVDPDAADDPDGSEDLGPDWGAPTGEALSTECNTMIISEDDVFWRAYPKHCDIQYETTLITQAQLENILGDNC